MRATLQQAREKQRYMSTRAWRALWLTFKTNFVARLPSFISDDGPLSCPPASLPHNAACAACSGTLLALVAAAAAHADDAALCKALTCQTPLGHQIGGVNSAFCVN